MRLRVQSLALLRGLRFWRGRELWCRLQTWLRSHVAVAVAGGCSSDETPSLGASICQGIGPRNGKKTKDKKKKTSYNSRAKNNQSDLKMHRGSEQTFSQERETYDQQAHEKMPHSTNHRRNAKQNHGATSPGTCQNGYY